MRRVFGLFLFLVFISLAYGKALELNPDDDHSQEPPEPPSLKTYGLYSEHDIDDHLEHLHSQEPAPPSLKHETYGLYSEHDIDDHLEHLHSQEPAPPSLKHETYDQALEHDFDDHLEHHHFMGPAAPPSIKQHETYDRALEHDSVDNLEHQHFQEPAGPPSIKYEDYAPAFEYEPDDDLEEHNSQEFPEPSWLNDEAYDGASEPDGDDEEYYHFQEYAEPKSLHYETTYDKFYSEQLSLLKQLTDLRHHLPNEIYSNEWPDNKDNDNNGNLIMQHDEFGPLWMVKLFDMDDDDRDLDHGKLMFNIDRALDYIFYN
ncbi:uncharacterized protein LOC126879877 isoform X5 [Diabrotica virgifera virgifera]|uniref:Uncharacterized protein n=1 Tax=Diabrotica virgifera virgifera TaxID=50390 RepID=A0ABM5JMI3_DIAVI|nr:uncharacterized protein LOC126879877 isoform X5 [Diabrotica virgifera virgifera]